MSNSQKKAMVLGMAFGTANGQLRKRILFSLVRTYGLSDCFRCGDPITCPSDFSIEHKMPWLTADSPMEAFFDLDNIAFSHLRCNVGAANREKTRCPKGHEYTGDNTARDNRGSRNCKECKRARDRRHYKTDKYRERRKKYPSRRSKPSSHGGGTDSKPELSRFDS